ncbi:hypothetical protein [Caballeronia sp. ATUFL_M1_KS5A]|uniref:hypothetical protein n=1 Tax=Caballeronia sp. ATUFL_M1_KS5A TaxID=2921778 RepID=UPI002028844B|nr:hypothetical protein [Caballeronia sp. ATUFL_M1_KS5A]
MNYTEAFRGYGAKLINSQWAFSAIADNGDLVVSLWAHKIKRGSNAHELIYRDSVSRSGKNKPGHNLFAEHLAQAYSQGLRVRVVRATAEDASAVDAGKDGSKLKKSFDVWKEFVGRVSEFDGDNYLLVFEKVAV